MFARDNGVVAPHESPTFFRLHQYFFMDPADGTATTLPPGRAWVRDKLVTKGVSVFHGPYPNDHAAISALKMRRAVRRDVTQAEPCALSAGELLNKRFLCIYIFRDRRLGSLSA